MSKRLRYALIAAAAVLVAAIGYWRWGAGSKPKTQMETAKVDRGRIIAKVTATGTLSALVTVQVGSQVSGRIAELRADFNSPVKKGQLIAKIDPQLFQAIVEQQRANLVAARGNLAKARAQAIDAQRQAERSQALVAKKLIAQADADTAQANADALAAGVTAAEGEVAQTQAALNSAQVNLDYTNILSPTDGVVISRNVDVGQTVAASFAAPILFVIAEDLAKMQVDTSVAEADVGRLQPGMDATFNVDAFPSEIFKGKVRQIRNAPQTVQNVVTYDAVIDVQNGDLKLRPGMTANVTFIYAQKDDVVRVPNAALRFKPPPGLVAEPGARSGGRPDAGAVRAGGDKPPAAGAGGRTGETLDRRAVWVLKEERPVQVKVRTGISDGTFTEVIEGELEAGAVVITDAVGPPSGMAAAMRGGF